MLPGRLSFVTRVGRVVLVPSPSFLLSWYCSPFPVHFVSAASGVRESALGVFPPLSPVVPFFVPSFVVTKFIAFSTSIHVGRLTVLPLFYVERNRRVVSEREGRFGTQYCAHPVHCHGNPSLDGG